MGRGYSQSRSLTGRLVNKQKRSRSVSLLGAKTRQIRSRSELERNGGGMDLEGAGGNDDNKDKDNNKKEKVVNDDAGKSVHRSIVAQVRARSAMLRQRVLRSASAPNTRGQGDFGDSDEDLVSEPDDERVHRPEVLVKYKACGKITDQVMARLVASICPGASVFDLCNHGDAEIETLAEATFSKAKDAETGEPIKRGISFPTNISVNNVLCHSRPLDEAGDYTLQLGDVVKIHLGTHIDGYATSAARTVVVSSALAGGVEVSEDSGNAPSTAAAVATSPSSPPPSSSTATTAAMPQAAANAVAAAHHTLNALIRGMRIGALGSELTDLIRSITSSFGVESCEGVLSNRTKRWILDGSQCIIGRRVMREEPLQDVAEVEIGPYQVWTLDVAVTTGQTYKLLPEEATLYRRNELPSPHQMRIRSAERLLSEIKTKFLCFPFCPTMSELGANHARLGVSQLLKAGVVDMVPPMRARHGAITARASCTIAVTEKRIHVLAGMPSAMDVTAAAVAEPLSGVFNEYVTKPLSFVVSSARAQQQQGEDGGEQGGASASSPQNEDVPLSEDVGGDDDNATAKQKGKKNIVLHNASTAGHTKAQLAAMLPPSSKKKVVSTSNAAGEDNIVPTERKASPVRDQTTGQKPNMQRRVE